MASRRRRLEVCVITNRVEMADLAREVACRMLKRTRKMPPTFDELEAAAAVGGEIFDEQVGLAGAGKTAVAKAAGEKKR